MMVKEVVMSKRFLSILICIVALFNVSWGQENGESLWEEEEEFLQLEQTVVTAVKHEQELIDTPATVYVFSDKDIKRYNFSELEDVLRITPGIDVEDNNFFLLGGQRGLIGVFDNTLVLIDGVEMNNLIAGEAFISRNYPLFDVKRVEIVQGPASALYGANAVGGVINLITKTAQDINGVTAGLTFGSYNTFIPFVSLGGVDGKFKFRVFARAYISDEANFYKEVTDFEHFAPNVPAKSIRPDVEKEDYEDPTRAYYINARVGWKDFYLGTIFSYQKVGRGTSGVQWIYDRGHSDTRKQVIVYTGFNRDLTDDLNLKFDVRFWNDWLWGNHLEVNYIGVVSNGEVQTNSDGTPVTNLNPTAGDIENWRGFYSNLRSPGSRRGQVELQITYKLFETHRLTAGLVYDYLSAVSASWNRVDWSTIVNSPTNAYSIEVHPYVDLGNQKYDAWKVGGYIQYELPLFNNSLLLTLGTRFDHQKDYGSILNPRSGLVFKLSDTMALKVLYGEAFREPSPFEIYKALKENPSSPQIPEPTKERTFEVGHFWKKGKFQNTFNIYYNYVTKMKVSISSFGGGINQVDEMRGYGIEEQVVFSPLDRISVMLNYTYENGRIKYGNQEWEYVDLPNHKANASITYTPIRRLFITITGHYIGRIKTREGNPLGEIPPYFIVDSSILFRDLMGKYDLSFSVRNLLNKQYWSPNCRGGGEGVSPASFPQEGTSFWITLSSKI